MLNKVILQGRLCADVELRYTQSQIAVAKFIMAVDRSYVKKGEEKKTDFIGVTTFRSTAEFVSKWFSKGQMILVDGTLKSRTWEQDGKKMYGLSIIANEVSFCGEKAKKPDAEESYRYDERRGMELDDPIGFDECDFNSTEYHDEDPF